MSRPRVRALLLLSAAILFGVCAGTRSERARLTLFSFRSTPAVVDALPDSDGDGLPDAWELAQGADPYDPADAALDLDGDGLNALAEFKAGRDPWRFDGDETVDAAASDADPDNRCELDVWRPVS